MERGCRRAGLTVFWIASEPTLSSACSHILPRGGQQLPHSVSPAARRGAASGCSHTGRFDRRQHVVALGEGVVLPTAPHHPVARLAAEIAAVRPDLAALSEVAQRTASLEKRTVPSSSVISNAPALRAGPRSGVALRFFFCQRRRRRAWHTPARVWSVSAGVQTSRLRHKTLVQRTPGGHRTEPPFETR
jgi:hypothetical protein